MSSHINAFGDPGRAIGLRSKYEGWKIGIILEPFGPSNHLPRTFEIADAFGKKLVKA